MTVLPVFWIVMRNTTLLPMATGVFVGLSKNFVTLSAECVTSSVTLEELTAVPPLAVAKFVAIPVASVINVTVMFVLWPGVIVPMLVHVTRPVVATVLGERLAVE